MKPDETDTKIPIKDPTNFVLPETLSCHGGPCHAQAPAPTAPRSEKQADCCGRHGQHEVRQYQQLLTRQGVVH